MKKRALIAEDDALMRRLLENVLTTNDFTVTMVCDGDECLRALAQAAPLDVLLLDLMMPGATGLEILASLRDQGRLPRLPVVVLTGSSELETVKEALRLGAADYVVKPFERDRLVTRLRELTFVLAPGQVRWVLANLRLPDTALFRAPGLTGVDKRKYDLFATSFEGVKICVAVSREMTPLALSRVEDDRMLKGALVFVLRAGVWRPLEIEQAG